MATIRDVALKAGVSLGTASQAISGRGKVSAKALSSVLEAAQELGYQYIDRTSAKRHTIGLFMVNTPKDVYEGFFGMIVGSIVHAAEEKGYRVLVRHIHDPIAFSHSLSTPGERIGMDGAIIYPHFETPNGFYDFLKGAKFPIIILGDYDSNFSSVVIDNEGGIALSVKHLAELGHKRIAYITHGGEIIDDHRRREGFLSSMQNLGLESSVLTLDELRYAVNKDRLNLPFTALACFDDARALAAIRILIEYGLRIPDDVSVIGFGCYDQFLQIIPELTSIDHPVKEHARYAFRLLSEIIEGEQTFRTRLEVSCSLNPGGTTRSIKEA